MSIFADINLLFEKREQAKIVLEALSVEAMERDRSRLLLKTRGNELLMGFEAKDKGALRAALNSYLRLVKTADSVL